MCLTPHGLASRSGFVRNEYAHPARPDLLNRVLDYRARYYFPDLDWHEISVSVFVHWWPTLYPILFRLQTQCSQSSRQFRVRVTCRTGMDLYFRTGVQKGDEVMEYNQLNNKIHVSTLSWMSWKWRNFKRVTLSRPSFNKLNHNP